MVLSLIPVLTHARPLALAVVLVLYGCALNKAEPVAVFDLGLPQALATSSTAATPPSLALPALQVVDIAAPTWLATTGIAYRLAYADPLRREVYRDSRWTAPPAALLTERLRQRLAIESQQQGQAGAGQSIPLRLALEEFGQSFAGPSQSQVRLRVRARLGDAANAPQRVFEVQRPAASADAQGAVQGLSQASEQFLEELLEWLRQQPRPSGESRP
ncbi:ABC-type transport auxiliary lipoprotein family protein [Roseateles sp.]|uniref:ABC-type transport auxiliary lipoprotein family protein n=1 Tax=Roseateles sp. TaxID=1971397 RepID=UPI003BA5826A